MSCPSSDYCTGSLQLLRCLMTSSQTQSHSHSHSRAAQFHAFRNPAAAYVHQGSSPQSQSKRRQDALDRQRQERNKSFSLHRDGLDSLADALELSDSDSDSGDIDKSGELAATNGDATHEASDDQSMQTEAVSSSSSSISADRAKAGIPRSIKRKVRPFARLNRLALPWSCASLILQCLSGIGSPTVEGLR